MHGGFMPSVSQSNPQQAFSLNQQVIASAWKKADSGEWQQLRVKVDPDGTVNTQIVAQGAFAHFISWLFNKDFRVRVEGHDSVQVNAKSLSDQITNIVHKNDQKISHLFFTLRGHLVHQQKASPRFAKADLQLEKLAAMAAKLTNFPALQQEVKDVIARLVGSKDALQHAFSGHPTLNDYKRLNSDLDNVIAEAKLLNERMPISQHAVDEVPAKAEQASAIDPNQFEQARQTEELAKQVDALSAYLGQFEAGIVKFPVAAEQIGKFKAEIAEGKASLQHVAAADFEGGKAALLKKLADVGQRGYVALQYFQQQFALHQAIMQHVNALPRGYPDENYTNPPDAQKIQLAALHTARANQLYALAEKIRCSAPTPAAWAANAAAYQVANTIDEKLRGIMHNELTSADRLHSIREKLNAHVEKMDELFNKLFKLEPVSSVFGVSEYTLLDIKSGNARLFNGVKSMNLIDVMEFLDYSKGKLGSKWGPAENSLYQEICALHKDSVLQLVEYVKNYALTDESGQAAYLSSLPPNEKPSTESYLNYLMRQKFNDLSMQKLAELTDEPADNYLDAASLDRIIEHLQKAYDLLAPDKYKRAQISSFMTLTEIHQQLQELNDKNADTWQPAQHAAYQKVMFWHAMAKIRLEFDALVAKDFARLFSQPQLQKHIEIQKEFFQNIIHDDFASETAKEIYQTVAAKLPLPTVKAVDGQELPLGQINLPAWRWVEQGEVLNQARHELELILPQLMDFGNVLANAIEWTIESDSKKSVDELTDELEKNIAAVEIDKYAFDHKTDIKDFAEKLAIMQAKLQAIADATAEGQRVRKQAAAQSIDAMLAEVEQRKAKLATLAVAGTVLDCKAVSQELAATSQRLQKLKTSYDVGWLRAKPTRISDLTLSDLKQYESVVIDEQRRLKNDRYGIDKAAAALEEFNALAKSVEGEAINLTGNKYRQLSAGWRPKLELVHGPQFAHSYALASAKARAESDLAAKIRASTNAKTLHSFIAAVEQSTALLASALQQTAARQPESDFLVQLKQVPNDAEAAALIKGHFITQFEQRLMQAQAEMKAGSPALFKNIAPDVAIDEKLQAAWQGVVDTLEPFLKNRRTIFPEGKKSHQELDAKELCDFDRHATKAINDGRATLAEMGRDREKAAKAQQYFDRLVDSYTKHLATLTASGDPAGHGKSLQKVLDIAQAARRDFLAQHAGKLSSTVEMRAYAALLGQQNCHLIWNIQSLYGSRELLGV